ncbi:MAG: 30S ribosomal protein S16 [Micrococcales bacterium]|nr:30S ribosomal protein S16 [Micrococcales bacterium]
MAVKIKLKRLGKIRNPQYRVVVADARNKRDGRAIEEIGLYRPKEQPSFIQIDSERAQYWLAVGAQPTEAVMALLKVTGDWQKFKGLPGAEGTLQSQQEKTDRKSVFAAAAAEAAGLKEAQERAPKQKTKPAQEKPAQEPVTEVPEPEATAPEATEPTADEPTQADG